jgi:hypothetical protein
MSKPGPVVLLSPGGRRSGSGGRTSRELTYLRHYVLPARHACLSHRYSGCCRAFARAEFRLRPCLALMTHRLLSHP